MNYGELIKDAFWISWRNHFLWFFGFFAGGTSVGAYFNIPSGNFGGFDEEDFGGKTPAPSFDPG